MLKVGFGFTVTISVSVTSEHAFPDCAVSVKVMVPEVILLSGKKVGVSVLALVKVPLPAGTVQDSDVALVVLAPLKVTLDSAQTEVSNPAFTLAGVSIISLIGVLVLLLQNVMVFSVST